MVPIRYELEHHLPNETPRLRDDHIQANKGKITIGMSETGIISIPGEPASKSLSDIPGLYWCCGSDSWKRWELGDDYAILELSKVTLF